MVNTPITHFTVAGKLNDPQFQKAKKAAEIIRMAANSVSVTIFSLLPTDYEMFVQTISLNVGLDRPHRGNLITLEGPPGHHKYIGGIGEFAKFCKLEFGYSDKTNSLMYERMAKVHFRTFMQNSGNQFVYMDIRAGDNNLGRVVIECFQGKVPETCKNFMDLAVRDKPAEPAEGEEPKEPEPMYKGSKVHRVVPGGWIQFGDIVTGKGNDGVAANGDKCFADETFLMKHDKPGIVAMANTGPHTNGSQFYITLDALPWLDNRRVAFGRVIDGMRVLRVLSKMEMSNERPVAETIIRDCGVLVV